MADSQDLDGNTQHDLQFQTPSRFDTQGTQTQKSQASGRTFMMPNSHPNDYHNSASTTTSGQKTSNRSSDVKSNTQSSNNTGPPGLNFQEMMPQPGGSQLPDTQGSRNFLNVRFAPSPRLSPQGTTNHVPPLEVHYVSSQPSNSDPSPSSQQQQNAMAAPAPPRHTSNLGSILNNEEPKPLLILDESQLNALHQWLVKNTSGCSLEQLEQINATLMDAIWRNRANYNRNQVIHGVQEAFNKIIVDIQAMQDILKWSQEDPQEDMYHAQDTQYTSAQPPPAPRRHGVPPPTGEGYQGITQHAFERA